MKPNRIRVLHNLELKLSQYDAMDRLKVVAEFDMPQEVEVDYADYSDIEILEDVFDAFNGYPRPGWVEIANTHFGNWRADGHAPLIRQLSVGDVVIFEYDTKIAAFSCNSFGWSDPLTNELRIKR